MPNPGNPQSLNRYSYVLNNPLRYTDPTGHWIFEETPDDPYFIPPHLYPAQRRKDLIVPTMDVGPDSAQLLSVQIDWDGVPACFWDWQDYLIANLGLGSDWTIWTVPVNVDWDVWVGHVTYSYKVRVAGRTASGSPVTIYPDRVDMGSWKLSDEGELVGICTQKVGLGSIVRT